MKKIFAGTTALVAGSLIAGSAMAAKIDVATPEIIDDGFTVTWNGYIRAGFYAGDADCSEANGTPCIPAGPDGTGSDPKSINTTVPLKAELQLFAEQTLANGLRIGGEIDFDIDNGSGSSATIDEVWLFIDGTFGQIRLGQKDNALDTVGDANKPEWGAFNGFVDDPDLLVLSSYGAAGFAIGDVESITGISGDANKITYLSPEFAGINLGVSFSPDPQNQRPTGTSLAINGDGNVDADGWLNEWSIGANITKTWGEHTFRVAGGFTSASAEKNNRLLDDVGIWKIAGSVRSSYGGIGAWYSSREYDLATVAATGAISTTDGTVTETITWGIQGNIISGDYTFGAGYLRAEDTVYSTGGTANTDNELNLYGIGVAKKIGRGVEMGINAQYEDYTGTYNSVTATRGHQLDGWLAGWYTAIAF